MTRSTMTERAWRDQVMELAALTGWRVYAVENSTREIVRRSGARIRVRNVNAAGVGFPDLVMVRGRDRRLVFAELKRDPQRGHHWPVTAEQSAWLVDLLAAGAEAYIWRPSDLPDVERVLNG